MKIFLETYDDRYKDRIAFIDTIRDDLSERHDINFVNEFAKADLVMSQQVSYAPKLDFCLNQKKDVIIIEVNDSASIKNDELRRAIKNPRVKGFFKVTNFKNKEDHNKPTSGDVRYHANFINHYAKLCALQEHAIVFSDQELKKIQCAIPSFLNFRMDPVRNAEGLTNQDREFDLNFAGTTDYTKNKNYKDLSPGDPKLNLPLLIGMHRKWAIEQIMKVTHDSKLRSIITDHKPMSQPEYWNSLYHTKVCVSPWGFGAYNWRDYEAIYLGAVLLKPNTDFLETYCDLFQAGKHYVDCAHDFSDLPERVLSIIEGWEKYTPIRKSAVQLLKDNNNIRRLSDRFAKDIDASLQR